MLAFDVLDIVSDHKGACRVVSSDYFGSKSEQVNVLTVVDSAICSDKDRELKDAQDEIKSLKITERLKEKALEEVRALVVQLKPVFLGIREA
jgi:hypothetical protein